MVGKTVIRVNHAEANVPDTYQDSNDCVCGRGRLLACVDGFGLDAGTGGKEGSGYRCASFEEAGGKRCGCCGVHGSDVSCHHHRPGLYVARVCSLHLASV